MRLQGINHPRLCTSSDRPLRSLSQLAVPNITGAEDSPYLGGESWSAPQIGPNPPHMARTSIHHTIIHVSQHQILRIPKQINQISHKQDARREAEKHLSGNQTFQLPLYPQITHQCILSSWNFSHNVRSPAMLFALSGISLPHTTSCPYAKHPRNDVSLFLVSSNLFLRPEFGADMPSTNRSLPSLPHIYFVNK